VTVVALTSLAGAPGVTTTAAALAVHWPRPVLLIEADTSAVSTLRPGFFRANLPTRSGGIENLSYAMSRSMLESSDILNPSFAISIAVHELAPIAERPIPALPAGHQMWVVPGFVNHTVIDGVRSMWPRLPNLLAALSETNTDVILDLGRLSIDDPRLALLDTADQVIIAMSTSLIDLVRNHQRLEVPDLKDRARALAGERYWMLLNEAPAQQLPARDFTSLLGLPAVATLPHDPIGAAVFSHGNPDAKPNRNAYRAAIRRLAQDIQELDSRQERSVS
jgi:hypothetical protein